MDGHNYINEIAFSQPVINIGADGGNDIILRGLGVADFHLMLNYASNVWHLVPLDPSYTTLVNGRGIGPEGCPVQNGAVLSIGDYRLTLSLNGTNVDVLVAQMVSAVSNQSSSAITEESEDSSILLSLSDKLVPSEIDAGSTVEYELTVTNAGPLVANMQLQLQGIPSAWVQIIPPVLNLNEGRSGNFVVRVSPPRTSAAKAGLYQLHFVALSPNYPRETGSADAVLTILPYNDFLVNGPTPRRLNLSRSHPSDFADLNIINNSNAAAAFVIRSYDDANEMNYAYRQDAGNLTQGQIAVTVSPGDNERVPIQVEARKRPLVGLTSHMHHYYTSVTPTDRPGDAQTLLGEVSVRPMIHLIWLVIILLVLAITALVFFQPYIHQFDSLAGKRTEVILSGNSAGITWNVSRFATMITLSDGTEEHQVSHQGSEFLSPGTSTTYTLKAENFLSNLLGFKYEKQFRLLLIPRRPTIDVFKTDTVRTNYSQPVRLDWAVSADAETASLVTNKQGQALAAENYSGNQTNNYSEDVLISLKAVNASGYEEKSVFVNVSPDKINLKKFIAWVRPNGIAVPSNNDTRRTTRWGSLQLYATATPAPQMIRQAVNPQPDVQSNTILIPDNFASAGSSQSGINPEQQSVNRILGSSSDGLLVGPYTDALPTSTPAPTAVPTAAVSVRSPIASSSAPSNSPEGSNASREFSIKLVEVVEDPQAESGYRVIDYFPDYVLQKGEQIRIEWEVEGLPEVTIDNLAADKLTASGAEFAYPEKSTNYVLTGEVGTLKKAYSLPVNVAGESDDGQGSGLKCELKANATTLTVPGTVMLTWTGGGNNRVQLISSAKAEQENNDAEKEKEAEAKEKGESYTRPTNAPLSGGIIGDYLQPSGFMRINVDQQTTFVLNAYDGSGNIICTKDVEIKYTGGNDKLDLKLAITKITDTDDVSQPFYTVGQTVQFTVALTDYEKGKDPTGAVMLTDGDSACTMTLPKDTCSMVMKHAGTRKITAVYGGDDTYNKKTATGYVTVADKIDTETLITSALKSAEDAADLVTELKYSSTLADKYKKTPTGTITFTVGSGTCDLDLSTLKLSCGGDASKSENTYTVQKMPLSDTDAKTVRAKYSGDDYFNPSQSAVVKFPGKIDTVTKIISAGKYEITYADLVATLTWDEGEANGLTPTGTIKFTIRDGEDTPGAGDTVTGTCELDIVTLKLSCEAKEKIINTKGNFEISRMLLADKTADRIKAEYSGDSFFNASESSIVLFDAGIPTTIDITEAAKNGDYATAIAFLTWEPQDYTDYWNNICDIADKENICDAPEKPKPSGSVKFVAGSGSCTLTIDTGILDCLPKTGMVDADHKTFTVEDMLLDDKNADRIYAEYSGDRYFRPSTSVKFLFTPIDTTLEITDAIIPKPNYADVKFSLIPEKDAGRPTGTVTFSTIHGNVCKLTIPDDPDDLDLDCMGTVSYDNGFYTINDMWLDDSSVDWIKVSYEGSDMYKASNDQALILTTETNLEIASVSMNDEGTAANATVTLNYDDKFYTDFDAVPSGILSIAVGPDTCKVNLETKEIKCGGTVTGNAEIDSSSGTTTITMTGLPLSNMNIPSVSAKYEGDTVYLMSNEASKDFVREETTTLVTLYKKNDNAGTYSISTRISYNGLVDGKYPGGTLTYVFESSGTTCTVSMKRNSSDTISTTCGTEIGFNSDNGATDLFYTLKQFSADPTDHKVNVMYSGDGNYSGSGPASMEAQKIEVIVVPYNAGNIPTYINYSNNNAYYPINPILHPGSTGAYAYCNLTGTLTTDCKRLSHTYQPKVEIKLADTSFKLPADATVTFHVDGQSLTCTAYETAVSGTYRCDADGAFAFTSLGRKTIKAVFDGEGTVFENAEVDFPSIYVINIPNPAHPTSVLISKPEANDTVELGGTLTVKADTIYTQSGGMVPVTEGTLIAYTYDSTFQRYSYCVFNSPHNGTCELRIEDGPTHLAVEYLGYDSGSASYAPGISVRQLTIVLPGGSSIAPSPDSTSSGLPVSISLEIEPVSAEP